jgi:hypothetical protein
LLFGNRTKVVGGTVGEGRQINLVGIAPNGRENATKEYDNASRLDAHQKALDTFYPRRCGFV